MFTVWEYAALWRRFGWLPDQVDEMPQWLVRECLTVKPR